MKALLCIAMLVVGVTATGQFKNTGFYGKDSATVRSAGSGYADGQVTDMVTSMCEKMGFKNRYIIQSNPAVANCQALLNTQGKPVIYYNDAFLRRVAGFNFTTTTLPGVTDDDWKTLTILAHELGHHVNLHLINPMPGVTDPEMELEADRFAGHMLHTLGATLQQAQAAINDASVSDKDTYTHPGRPKRLKAVEEGWKEVRVVEIPTNNNTTKTTDVTPATNPTGPIDMEFVEGGSFIMGSNDGQEDEKPVHKVTVSDFYIGKYEITQALWKKIMGNNPSMHRDCDDCPVEYITWDEAQNFIKALNARYPGNNYRLPTEAEWEYAGRGGKKAHGYKWAGAATDLDVKKYGWIATNLTGYTNPIASKLPNELKLFDMSGNVWEWCSDWYGSYQDEEQTNPTGPLHGTDHVLRGGSYGSHPLRCTVSSRSDAALWYTKSVHGLRLARSKQ